MTDIKINPNLFKKFDIKLAYLFGSRAKGNDAEESDFDIAVLFKKEPSNILALNEIVRLSSDLDKYFPAKVDIVNLHHAPLLLKYEVVAHNHLLYCENEIDRINFEVSVIKEYIDEEPIRRLYDEALHKRILQGV